MNKTQCISVALGLSLAMIIAPASAAGKGPRASVSSSTTCSLDFNGAAFLVVTTTLENKSSGATVPEVRDWSELTATIKTGPGPGFEDLQSVLVEDIEGIDLPMDVNPTLTLSYNFPLCDAGGVLDKVAGARELNGVAMINYGISGGVDDETREVVNRCTDPDPNDGVDWGGGIRVADVIADIEAACAP